MKQRLIFGWFLFLLILFPVLWIPELVRICETDRLDEDTVMSPEFRSQPLEESRIREIKELEEPGELLGIYWLESDFGHSPVSGTIKEMAKHRGRWEKRPGWEAYLAACQSVWDDLKYFPVAEGSGLTVGYEDSWMYDRSYGGERGHEGTDLMPSANRRGEIPVVSMTDGVVENMGWLELGGYRVGIRAPGGGYFYYAHLDSYGEIREGDQIPAGTFLGYMGDTGYSRTEGATGNFPVHLHLGIYIAAGKEEISVNPYPALRYTEDSRISWSYSSR